MMRTKGKVSVLVLIVILLFLSVAGGLFYFLQKERINNVNLQQQLQEVQERQRITEAKLGESKKMISAFEVKLKETQVQIETLTTDLEAEKNAKQESITQVERLKTELDQQKLLRADLEQKFEEAQAQIKKSQDQLTQLDTRKAELEEKVKALEAKSQDLEAKVQGIELGTIVVSPEAKQQAAVTLDQAPANTEKAGKVSKAAKDQQKSFAKKKAKKAEASAGAALEGNVLVVNKDYNFAVINIGNKEGVKTGNVFSVYHNNKIVGDLKVEKVHESMSAAGFVVGNLKDVISEGDKVVLKL